MRFISFNIICSTTALVVSCTFDKGKDVSPATAAIVEICDTATVVSYSLHISAIINTHCISCHGPSETTKLYDYATVKVTAQATSGSLYSAVSHDGTAIPMPPNRSLSDCGIDKIKKWVDAGVPNN